MKKLVGLTIVFFLVVMPSAYSLAISPATIDIKFEPDYSRNYGILLINSKNETTFVRIVLEGELKDTMNFQETVIELDPLERKIVPFRVTLPYELSPPGTHKAQIIAEEVIPEDEGVAGLIKVISELRVKVDGDVPIEETGSLEIVDIESSTIERGTIGRFNILVENTDQRESFEIYAHIDITKGTTIIGTVNSESIIIPPRRQMNLFAEWNTINIPSGDYEAVVTIFGENIVIEQNTTIESAGRMLREPKSPEPQIEVQLPSSIRNNIFIFSIVGAFLILSLIMFKVYLRHWTKYYSKIEPEKGDRV